MANVTFEIKKTIAVIGHGTKGWQRELNLVSWNGATPKYDLRDWDPEHTKMGKGITLSVAEATLLVSALASDLGFTTPVPASSSEPEPKAEPVCSQSEPKTSDPEPTSSQSEPAPISEPEPVVLADPVNGFSAAQLAAIEKAKAMMAGK